MKENTGKTIRWGIMGTGWIAEQFAADLTYVNNGKGAAVGSRTRNSAEQFAAKFNIPRAYGSYEELANDPEMMRSMWRRRILFIETI